MKKDFSLKQNHIFSKVLKEGKKNNTNFFLLSKLKKNDPQIKIGISVPKKIGNAVLRNKIKRQIKAILDQEFNSIEDLNYYFIIMVKKPFIDLNYDQKSKILLEKTQRFLKENNE